VNFALAHVYKGSGSNDRELSSEDPIEVGLQLVGNAFELRSELLKCDELREFDLREFELRSEVLKRAEFRGFELLSDAARNG
jgi:hypothetical protein